MATVEQIETDSAVDRLLAVNARLANMANEVGTPEELAERLGMSPLALKLWCAAGLLPFGYEYADPGPFVGTADEVAHHFGVDRRTVQNWKKANPPMPWESGKYDLTAIHRWRAQTFEDGNGPDLVRAVFVVVRSELVRAMNDALIAIDDTKGVSDGVKERLRQAVLKKLATHLRPLILDDEEITALLATCWPR